MSDDYRQTLQGGAHGECIPGDAHDELLAYMGIQSTVARICLLLQYSDISWGVGWSDQKLSYRECLALHKLHEILRRPRVAQEKREAVFTIYIIHM